jgi:hypothetical protein
MIERLTGAARAPLQRHAPNSAATIGVADLGFILASHALYFLRNLLFICKASIDEIFAGCQAVCSVAVLNWRPIALCTD